MKGQATWWIFILAINLVQGQDLSKTLAFASKNLKHGQLSEAEMLFRRVAFFDSSAVYERETLEGLAHVSYGQEKYSEASAYFLNLSRISGSRLDYYYHTLSLIKGEEWMLAKAALLSIQGSTIDVRIAKQVMLGLVEFSLRNFEASKERFAQAESLLSAEIDDEAIFKKVYKVNKKSSTKAIVLSGILPGSGQAYSGHYGEGVNSLLLMGAIGLLYYYTATNVGALDAIISVFPWVNRYYVGGMNTAAELVTDYKDEKFLTYYNELVALYGGYIR